MALPGRALKWSGASDHVLKDSFHDVFFLTNSTSVVRSPEAWATSSGPVQAADFGKFPDGILFGHFAQRTIWWGRFSRFWHLLKIFHCGKKANPGLSTMKAAKDKEGWVTRLVQKFILQLHSLLCHMHRPRFLPMFNLLAYPLSTPNTWPRSVTNSLRRLTSRHRHNRCHARYHSRCR